MMDKQRIVCFGEVLWDCLPSGLFLGGAPLNVAYHLRQLGEEPWMVSAVGEDFLGEETLARIAAIGVDTRLIKSLPDVATGAVRVRLSGKGDASYDFLDPSAWDYLTIDPQLAGTADAFVYGSLAMRKDANRQQLESALASCKGLKICDVNLRPGFDDPDYALRLLELADLAKLNEDELATFVGGTVSANDPKPAMQCLAEKTGTSRICLTMGAQGAAYYDDGQFFQVPAKVVEVRDTIGAGDAFMARFIHGVLRGEAVQQTLQSAANLGAFIASKEGAQPEYDPQTYRSLAVSQVLQ
jgi:fructokinase